MIALVLVSVVWAAAVPGPSLGSVPKIQRSGPLTSNSRRFEARGSSASVVRTEKTIAVVQFPISERPPSLSERSIQTQAEVQKAIVELSTAALTVLGLNKPIKGVKRKCEFSGYIAEPDLQTSSSGGHRHELADTVPEFEQYTFKVRLLMNSMNDMEGLEDKDEWLECKGSVGYAYQYNEVSKKKDFMVVSGNVVDPQGEPIVMLEKGKVVKKSEDVKKVHWANPVSSDM
ncbi:hypothetical protein J3R30DRAFT_3705964 [Lentinula aciculospora]|uniref:Peptidylprolyl isomerase n=1 Tax=Lentinula aciculospora TaxID=153920 RepID=A0A9W9A6F4_9AGAR|nr:hypothetical protein J3R30DRAFT_3705964 [Lentinula aciculospora]